MAVFDLQLVRLFNALGKVRLFLYLTAAVLMTLGVFKNAKEAWSTDEPASVFVRLVLVLKIMLPLDGEVA
jgi:hypothetical protein